jgi:hypothetical protein
MVDRVNEEGSEGAEELATKVVRMHFCPSVEAANGAGEKSPE